MAIHEQSDRCLLPRIRAHSALPQSAELLLVARLVRKAAEIGCPLPSQLAKSLPGPAVNQLSVGGSQRMTFRKFRRHKLTSVLNRRPQRLQRPDLQSSSLAGRRGEETTTGRPSIGWCHSSHLEARHKPARVCELDLPDGQANGSDGERTEDRHQGMATANGMARPACHGPMNAWSAKPHTL